METVYIVGAGASVDAEFPTGKDLKKLIAKDLAYDPDINGYMYGGFGNDTIHKALSRDEPQNTFFLKIRKAHEISLGIMGSASIDNYIDIHRDDQDIAEIGKLTIAKIISEKEEKSPLFLAQNRDYELLKLADMWFLDLIINLTTGCSFNELGDRFDKITFVIFNYDRCVEYFLNKSLAVLYRKTTAEVEDLIGRLTIIHPYGSLGSYHGFGTKAHPGNLKQRATNLKTFNESVRSEDSSVIQTKMREADRLIFLGFAFHPINMKLLSLETNTFTKKRVVKIYATTVGMSESDVKICEKVLNTIYKGRRKSPSDPNVEFNQNKISCSDLFREYNLSLGY